MASYAFNSSRATSVLTIVRDELEKSKLGLNASLILIVLLGFLPAFFVRWISKRKLPPSPPSWPLIGHLHLLGTHAHQSIAQLSEKYGQKGVMYMKFGMKGAIIVSTPEMAKEIFKKNDLAFSNRPQLIILDLLITNKQGAAFQQNTGQWRNLRKIFTQEMLSAKRMQSAAHLRARETDYMVNSIYRTVTQDPKASIDVNKRLWVLMTNFISRLVLSKRYFSNDGDEDSEEAKEFKYVMNEQSFLFGSIFPADSFPFLKWFDIGGLEKRALAFLPRFQGILTTILTERREKRKQEGDSRVDVDMLDVLLTNQEKGGEDALTEGNIRGLVWDAFAGGTDTQVTLIEWAMAHLLKAPRIMDSLRLELDNEVGIEKRVVETDLPRLKYLHALMKETFRLHPPAPLLLPHETHEACNVAGYYVPPNTRLFVNVWGMGRNPQVWDNPLEFRPERFLEDHLRAIDVQGQHYELIPFGTGRRICPAVAIGVPGVQFAIATLVQAFDWSLPDGLNPDDIDMTETTGLTVPMKTPLQAVPTPRLPTHLYAI